MKKHHRSLGRLLAELLADNERRYRRLRSDKGEEAALPRTDEQLWSRLAKAFPHSRALRLMAAGDLTINNYRSRINLGLYFPPEGPRFPPFFRYDERGRRVEPRHGRSPLTIEKQKQITLDALARRLTHEQRLGTPQDQTGLPTTPEDACRLACVPGVRPPQDP